MKPLYLIACFLITTNSIISQVSQTTETATIMEGASKGNKVPSAILNKFKADYPNEMPTWTMDKKNYRASFIDSKMKNGHAVAYDKNGAVVYREEQLAKGDYPAGIDAYFVANYPQDNYGVWSSMDRSGKRRFFSGHTKGILWFDESGKYVETVNAKK